MKQLKVFTLETPIGTLRGAVGGRGLKVLTLRQDEAAYFNRLLAKRAPGAVFQEVPAEATKAGRQLAAYFAGSRAKLDAAVDLEGLTEFTQDVLNTTLDIPRGQTLSYGEVARIIGRPRASRAVGQALHNNPVPLFVPCHRVVGSDGSLTGFGSGLPTKEILLKLESGENPF
ncbi:MAG: methylated-DNA--[protein]-cysteine S-methyltransferase [Desulfarculaceae bacterium]|nr:methylated-DNA--[protein]-cysteine S-methyltransferase [Desulfarculaceae bacterium]MCF8070825.1 methylated-DNA--[protein]-cysteine S-methyltransferase [Desulfarculaceae bacterium]MCF8102262.1 methylated-DNA--[protein]-cysteine S-methyltransferase [Desulfarculaceae bacterium]MCF8117676.1 methylated-DNA--[protein]-cysteine S-methyltransferase [Desulfarculaceae bacterium]